MAYDNKITSQQIVPSFPYSSILPTIMLVWMLLSPFSLS
jgi:hypothetical protein